MFRKNVWLIACVALLLGWLTYQFVWNRFGRDAADLKTIAEIDNARRKAALQRTAESNDPSDVSPCGTPLPRGFVSAYVPTDQYWFVGKFEDGPGVEIPFEPGQCADPPPELEPINVNPGFIGATACQECHNEIHDSFVSTRHALTLREVNDETINGDFSESGNRLQTSDPNVHFDMIRRDDGYYQQAHFYDWQFEVPMQWIVGSSKMAQTYLYWHGSGLYQHNVTHLTEENVWINSPGYIDGDAAYARFVPDRCLDCHATYFEMRKPPNHYTPNSLIPGVTCERCHGPGQSHVEYHRQHPEENTPRDIINPKSLDRTQQLEVCGQCHAGVSQLSGRALRFRPGDKLADFYHPAPESSTEENSVHTSNQLTRLAESECYRQSEMTCSDCHNPHEVESGEMRLLSDRCLTCHQIEACGLHDEVKFDLSENCIDCHMPVRPTKELRLRSIEGDIFPPLRDHKIRVDQAATEVFLKQQPE